MESKKKTIDVFIAEDGKEFLTKEDCENYEKNLLPLKKNIKYFAVFYNPDLTETGNYQSVMLIAVHSTTTLHYHIVQNYLVKDLNFRIICEGVMGYGIKSYFQINATTEEKYKSSKIGDGYFSYKYPRIEDKILLSPTTINGDGFPTKRFDYATKWGLRL